jgi:YesN/AraC family two-component response regulator
MDGIELIEALRRELPDIKTIIISGYEDFSYARSALRSGTIDYLLKPITPSTLQKTLENSIPLLESDKTKKQFKIIHALLSNETAEAPDENLVKEFFPAASYSVSLYRKNGLPLRFNKNILSSVYYKITDTAIDLYGRDEMEGLHIAAPSSNSDEDILIKDIPGYTTTVRWHKPVSILQLGSVVKQMYTVLDTNLSIGKTQVFAAGAKNCIKKSVPVNAEFKQQAELFAKNNNVEGLKKLFSDFIKTCEKETPPQMYVEKLILGFFEQIRFETHGAVWDEYFEFMIEDAFFYATTYSELQMSLLYVMEKTLPHLFDTIGKVDTPEFFALIRDYIHTHLAEPLTLQFLCTHFGISQTYMSRLFRKYTGQSFINYFNIERIEKAKQHLADKNMLIRDAAALVGFNDQFYFSKVFKTLTGITPSDYIHGCESPFLS